MLTGGDNIFYLDINDYNPSKVYALDCVELSEGVPQFIYEALPYESFCRPYIAEKTRLFIKNINQELRNIYKPTFKSTLLAIMSFLTITLSDRCLSREPNTMVIMSIVFFTPLF